MYGRTKLEAELRVLAAHPHALVVRTSACFSAWDARCFVGRALRDLAAGREVRCADDTLDAWARAYGTKWAALRYFNAAGAHPDGTLRESHEPETHLIPLAIDAALGRRPALQVFGSDYATPDGTCVRDYIHVQDLASAHLAALARLETGMVLGPVNLGTGRGYSVREVIDACGRLAGTAVPHDAAPRRAGDPPGARGGCDARRDDTRLDPDALDAGRDRRGHAAVASRANVPARCRSMTCAREHGSRTSAGGHRPPACGGVASR